MGSIGPAASGHRRRRSSLINPVSTAGGNNRRTLEEGGGLRGGSSAWDDAWNEGIDEENESGGETGLTAAERRTRAETRRQRTQLDQRIVSGSRGRADSSAGEGMPAAAAITADERKLADKSVVQRLLLNVTLIGLWYLFSLSISLYNKWMFGSTKLNFAFPLFTTSIHMLVQFVLSCVVLYFIPSLRPGAGRSGMNAESASGDDDDEDAYKPLYETESEPRKARMTAMFYLTRIGPCGAATGLDIGLGNTSLKFITLTFYTMCKSSSLAFVLLFAFLFRLETPTMRLVAIIATMTMGVIMMVAGEVEFQLGGFLLVIAASFFSGFRWGLTQIMLLRHPATSNPFSSIFYLAPVMFVTLFALAVPSEGLGALVGGFRELVDKFGIIRTPILVIFPGTIAFLMTASEFALLQRTSVVTLSIAGIFKEVLTITTATLVFHDTLTAINILGLVVTLAAITAYNYIKITGMRQQAQIDVHYGHRRRSSSASSSSSTVHSSCSRPTTAEFAITSSSSSSPRTNTPPVDGVDGSGAEEEADNENAGLLRKL